MYLLSSIFLFYGINILLQNIFPNKIADQFTSLSHALISSTITGIYIYSSNNLIRYNLIRNISSGYFIYDIINLLKYRNFSLMNLIYFYHHIASLYILNYGLDDKISYLLFWGELSNIPSYFVYYYLKTDIKKANRWKYIQKIIYSTIRIPILGYYTYNICKESTDIISLCLGVPVYIMGIIWSLKIIKN